MLRAARAARTVVVAASALALALMLAPAPQASGAAPKALVQGVVDRHGPVATKTAFRNVVNAGVISVNWSAIQKNQGGALTTGAIDDAIRRAENAGNLVKLKVYAGREAPNWAKNLDGAPYCLYDPPNTRTCYSMPRFWTANFRAAYDDLLSKLAARYENNETVTTLQVARCTTMNAEPFLRQAGTSANRRALLNAGFTVEKDEACLRQQLESHATLFPRTRSDLAIHPYHRIKSASAFASDQDFTRSIMNYCRNVLGTRCVLGHTSLGKRYDAGSPEAQMYRDIEALGAPIWMQTATMQKLGGKCADLIDALIEGDRRKASNVELPIAYDDKCTPDKLRSGDTALETNATS